MHADAFDIPAGQPFRKMPDFLFRHNHPKLFDNDDVAEYFGADITLAKGLIDCVVGRSLRGPMTSARLALCPRYRIPQRPIVSADRRLQQ
jgi:hypothetical protein